MRRMNFSIGEIGLVVALIAIDMAIWQVDMTPFGPVGIAAIRGTLVASSVLGWVLARLLAGRGRRPFLAGFLSAGGSALAAYWACCWLGPWLVLRYFLTPIDQVVIIGLFLDALPGLEDALLAGSPGARLFFDSTCFPLVAAIDSLPVLCVATLGGWASGRRAGARDRPRAA